MTVHVPYKTLLVYAEIMNFRVELRKEVLDDAENDEGKPQHGCCDQFEIKKYLFWLCDSTTQLDVKLLNLKVGDTAVAVAVAVVKIVLILPAHY